MPFEETIKIAIMSLIGSGLIFAYVGFQFKDAHLPIKVFLVAFAVMMIPLSTGLALRGLEEQSTGTAIQGNIISMMEIIYVGMIFMFVTFMGYLFYLMIRWAIGLLTAKKTQKILDEQDPTI